MDICKRLRGILASHLLEIFHEYNGGAPIKNDLYGEFKKWENER